MANTDQPFAPSGHGDRNGSDKGMGGHHNIVDYLFDDGFLPDKRDRIYLITPDREYSFGALYDRVCQVANLLSSLGIGVGDRIMFSVRDGIEFPSIFLGVMKHGAVSLPINTFLAPSDYAYFITDSLAKVVIVDAELADAVLEIAKNSPDVRHVFVTGDPTHPHSLDRALEDMPKTAPSRQCLPDDAAFWLYSSGSTGSPKGVIHAHSHIYWATELFGIGAQQIGCDDTILCPPKMFFAFGLGNQVYFPIRAGARVIANPAPARAADILASLIKYQPSLLVAVPTLYAGLLELMRAMDREAVREACGKLRFCVSGGEVLPPAVFQGWLEVTGTEILDGVGTTEMTHMFLINRPGQVVPGSCGRLVEGYQAWLLDDDGTEVGPGETGSLFVRGPTAASLYWNKPEATARSMRGGGIFTGDKFRRDEDWNFFYIGRDDDMLRAGGIWVSPAEIENTLAEHPDILECAVVGVPNSEGLVKLTAYVMLHAEHDPDDDIQTKLLAFLRDRLAHYKCPRKIVVVEDLPRTATGKIQRFRLRELS